MDIKPLFCMNTGVQMGGWFTKEVNAADDFKGLRYRMPGLGAEVLRRMGPTVVTTPGGEIFGSHTGLRDLIQSQRIGMSSIGGIVL
jgi:TRAP-type mannitol/chloroaromatic compound transport system substrate-binding protein